MPCVSIKRFPSMSSWTMKGSPYWKSPAIPYPLTEEKNLLESVYSHSPDRIQQHITQFYTYLSGQDKDVIYQTLAELAVSCKREFSGYQLEYCDWDEIHFQKSSTGRNGAASYTG